MKRPIEPFRPSPPSKPTPPLKQKETFARIDKHELARTCCSNDWGDGDSTFMSYNEFLNMVKLPTDADPNNTDVGIVLDIEHGYYDEKTITCHLVFNGRKIVDNEFYEAEYQRYEALLKSYKQNMKKHKENYAKYKIEKAKFDIEMAKYKKEQNAKYLKRLEKSMKKTIDSVGKAKKDGKIK